MSVPERAPVATGLGSLYAAAALVALVVPALSIASLVAGVVAGPVFLEFQAYTHLVMPTVFIVNLANLLLFLGASRKRFGPDRFRDLLSIGAIFSGISISIVTVMAGMFSSLGG